MMKVSATPFLALGLLLFLSLGIRRARLSGKLDSSGAFQAYGLLLLLLAWGITSSSLAIQKAYESASFLSLMPGLWLPLTPIVLVMASVLVLPGVRKAFQAIFDTTPEHWIILVHTLRILAVGTMIKALRGDFPAYFAFLVGGPDFLFGLSALPVAFLVLRSRLSIRTRILWNALGAIVILPAVPLIQLGLPGPLQIFTSEPTAEATFVFPMVLAPTLIVPLFLLLNILAVWRLLLKTRDS